MNSKPKTKNSKLAAALLDWFAANARDLPWRRTRDPYGIWVSEIMLQQTQVKTVIPYWEHWMRELPTVESVAKAGPAKIHKLWEGLGYYTRVRNLQKAAQVIVTECRRRGNESQNESGKRKAESGNPSGAPHVVSYKFPEEFEDVLALPGIGRYTAGAICSIAFNQPTPILDGNVIRVLTRIFGIAENPKEKETNARLWHLAEELVKHSSLVTRHPSPACSHLNQSLMELGALVCTPRNPQCQICPAKRLCVALHTNRVGKLPNLRKRERSTARRFMAFVIEHNGRFLVRQRPADVVNAHLWEFPNVEVGARLSEPQQRLKSKTPANSPAIVLAKLLRVRDPRSLKLSPLATVKHSITRYRITLEAFAISVTRAPSGTLGVWRTPGQMRRLAFTAAHKKLATRAANRILSGL